jgi:predicted nucleic acid-binding protein
MNLVVDASVAAKWLLLEEGSAKAEAFLEECKEGRYTPLAPEILGSEVAAVLWKRAMRGHLRIDQAKFLYQRFERIRPVLIPLTNLVSLALELALRYRHSVYDGLYVALAHQMNCGLLTADEDLHRTFGPDFPRIQLLRDWQR